MWSVSKDQGSAVAGFVLVAFPMLAIFSVTTSITLASFTRLVLLDATIEGARYASLADQDLESGISRTKDLVARSLGQAASVSVEASISRIGATESIRFVSTLGHSLVPGSRLISVSSVSTRELEY